MPLDSTTYRLDWPALILLALFSLALASWSIFLTTTIVYLSS